MIRPACPFAGVMRSETIGELEVKPINAAAGRAGVVTVSERVGPLAAAAVTSSVDCSGCAVQRSNPAAVVPGGSVISRCASPFHPKIPLDRMKHEHPLEYERLVTSKPETRPQGPPVAPVPAPSGAVGD